MRLRARSLSASAIVLFRGFFVVPIKKEGRAYTRPTTGTTKCLGKERGDTSQSGRVLSAAFSFEFGRFVVDQQPKRREIALVSGDVY